VDEAEALSALKLHVLHFRALGLIVFVAVVLVTHPRQENPVVQVNEFLHFLSADFRQILSALCSPHHRRLQLRALLLDLVQSVPALISSLLFDLDPVVDVGRVACHELLLRNRFH